MVQCSSPTVLLPPWTVIDNRPANFSFPGLNNEWTGLDEKGGLGHIPTDTGYSLQLRCVYVCNMTPNTISPPFVIRDSYQPGAMWGAALVYHCVSPAVRVNVWMQGQNMWNVRRPTTIIGLDLKVHKQVFQHNNKANSLFETQLTHYLELCLGITSFFVCIWSLWWNVMNSVGEPIPAGCFI